MPRCSARTRKGSQCRAYAVAGSPFCFSHDPSLLDTRTAVRRLGGQNKRQSLEVDLSNVDLSTTTGLRHFTDTLIRSTCALEPSALRSRTLGYLTRLQGRLIELNELDLRIQVLERVLLKREVPNEEEQ